jgi:hypothetical protein
VGERGAEGVVGERSNEFQHRRKMESEGGESRYERMMMVKLIV